MASIDIVPTPAANIDRAEGIWSKILHHAASYPLGVVGAVIMLMFVFAAVFADLITAYGPTTTNSAISLLPPGHGHPLGADAMGRDIYSRIVYGARISLAVGLGSTFARQCIRRRARADLRLYRRLGRPHHTALGRRACRRYRCSCWRW